MKKEQNAPLQADATSAIILGMINLLGVILVIYFARSSDETTDFYAEQMCDLIGNCYNCFDDSL
jgi:hypothetical protein